MTETQDGVRGASRAAVVWWFRGRLSQHEDQVHGLLKALEKQCPLRIYAAPVVSFWKAWHFFLRRYYPAADLPDPDILIGAGRETHWAMLTARWVRGGRIVTLSKSYLPRWLFDLCIIPAYAGGRSSKRMIATRGILPSPQAPLPKVAATGLIVIGGPSSQYRWSDDELIAQISEILSRHPDYRWYLTTTPQTPADTERRLQAFSAQNVFCIPHSETDAKWLLGRIQDAEQVWLTEDNLFTIYKALTAGAAVGVIPVPRRKPSKEITALEGLVVFFPAWQAGMDLHEAQPPFNESARCATEIYRRWLCNAV